MSRNALSHREETLESAWTESAASLVRTRFWLAGIAFLAAYLALNVATARYQFESFGITLWSPDNGLAALLLTEGVIFLPFVLAGAVLADVLISHVQHSFYATVLAESALTFGYAGLAFTLRDVLKFSPKRTDLANVLVMVAGVLPGAVLCSVLLQRPLSRRFVAR
jgi:integral membrane sensor domain MASE1